MPHARSPPLLSLFFSQPTLNVPAILTSHDSVIRLHIWAFLLRGTNFSSLLPFLTASFPIRRERGELCCYANEFNAQGPVSQLKQPMSTKDAIQSLLPILALLCKAQSSLTLFFLSLFPSIFRHNAPWGA